MKKRKKIWLSGLFAAAVVIQTNYGMLSDDDELLPGWQHTGRYLPLSDDEDDSFDRMPGSWIVADWNAYKDERANELREAVWDYDYGKVATLLENYDVNPFRATKHGQSPAFVAQFLCDQKKEVTKKILAAFTMKFDNFRKTFKK